MPDVPDPDPAEYANRNRRTAELTAEEEALNAAAAAGDDLEPEEAS